MLGYGGLLLLLAAVATVQTISRPHLSDYLVALVIAALGAGLVLPAVPVLRGSNSARVFGAVMAAVNLVALIFLFLVMMVLTVQSANSPFRSFDSGDALRMGSALTVVFVLAAVPATVLVLLLRPTLRRHCAVVPTGQPHIPAV